MTYTIPCSWQMYGTLEIEADSLEQAIEKAEDDSTALPTEGTYVDASFDVDREMASFLEEEAA